MAFCGNCKYYKVAFAPYIKQMIATCTYKGQHCSYYDREYYKKKKGEKHVDRGNQGKNV